MQDSQEILSYEQTPEFEGINSAGEAADLLRQAASEAGSAELLAISELVEKTQLSGEEGLDALEEATNRITEVNEGEIAEDAKPKVERVMFYLLSERVGKQMEIQLLKDAREVTNQQAEVGKSPQQRAIDARRALQEIGELQNVRDTAADERASEPLTVGGTRDPIYAAERYFRHPNEEDDIAFNTGFQNETQLKMGTQLIDLAYERIRQLGDGEKVPDTVMDVIGNRPDVVQLFLGYASGTVLDTGRALRMSFTELAEKVGLKLPEEITSRLDKPGPTSPPPPG